MEKELEQAFNRLDERLSLNNQNIISRLDNIEKRFEKLENTTGSHHEKLIRMEVKIEENEKDLRQRAEFEAVTGRALSKRIDDIDGRTDTQDTQITDMRIKYARIVVIVGVISSSLGIGGMVF